MRVVIVGAGLAGLSAAVALARLGVEVLVLEKMAQVGGSSALSSLNIAVAGSNLQRMAHINDSAKLFYDDMQAVSMGYANDKILSLIAEKSAAAFEFLLWAECEFKDELFLKDRHSLARVLSPKNDGLNSVILPLFKRAIDLGAKIITSCEVVSLQENNGQIVQITAVHRQNELSFKPDFIIFASGGFARDKKLISLQYPLAALAKSMASSKADAKSLKMLLKIGASSLHLELMRFAMIPNISGLKYSAILGKNRFINEDLSRQILARAILSQSPNAAYAIFDKRGLNLAFSEEEIEHFYAINILFNAKNLKELSVEIGFDIQRQIDEYNAGFKLGGDLQFGKFISQNHILPIVKEPFYALRLDVYLNYTLGGVAINKNTQVLDINGGVFKNLYAIGEVAGGVFGAARLNGCASCGCVSLALIASEHISKSLVYA